MDLQARRDSFLIDFALLRPLLARLGSTPRRPEPLPHAPPHDTELLREDSTRASLSPNDNFPHGQGFEEGGERLPPGCRVVASSRAADLGPRLDARAPARAVQCRAPPLERRMRSVTASGGPQRHSSLVTVLALAASFSRDPPAAGHVQEGADELLPGCDRMVEVSPEVPDSICRQSLDLANDLRGRGPCAAESNLAAALRGLDHGARPRGLARTSGGENAASRWLGQRMEAADFARAPSSPGLHVADASLASSAKEGRFAASVPVWMGGLLPRKRP